MDSIKAYLHWLLVTYNVGHFFNYQIAFRPTQAHANADSLSRLLLPHMEDSKLPQPTLFAIHQIETLPVTAAQLTTTTKQNCIVSKVLHYTVAK